MEGMGWSWDDLVATPLYVRRYCWDLLLIRRQADAQRAEDRVAERRAQAGGGSG
jgi:hypothetical protein